MLAASDTGPAGIGGGPLSGLTCLRRVGIKGYRFYLEISLLGFASEIKILDPFLTRRAEAIRAAHIGADVNQFCGLDDRNASSVEFFI